MIAKFKSHIAYKEIVKKNRLIRRHQTHIQLKMLQLRNDAVSITLL